MSEREGSAEGWEASLLDEAGLWSADDGPVTAVTPPVPAGTDATEPGPAASEPAVKVAPIPPWEVASTTTTSATTGSSGDAATHAGGGGIAAPPGEPPGDGPGGWGAGGRPVPPPAVKASPRDTGLGAVGVGLGAVALLLGLFFPFAIVLTVLLALGGVTCGTIALRHCVNTGAPGRGMAVGALVVSLLAVVALVMSLTVFSRGVREEADAARSALSDLTVAMDELGRGAEIGSLDLPGRGQAILVLDGVTFEIPLERCGFDDPVPGYRIAAFGISEEGRPVRLTLASETLGDAGDTVSVELGTRSYLLTGPQVFTRDGNQVTASGEFRVLLSNSTAQGSLSASCTA